MRDSVRDLAIHLPFTHLFCTGKGASCSSHPQRFPDSIRGRGLWSFWGRLSGRASDRLGDQGWEGPRVPHKGEGVELGWRSLSHVSERLSGDSAWRPMRPGGFTRLGAPIPGCPEFSPPYLWQGLGPAAWTFQALPQIAIKGSGVGEHSMMSHTLGVLMLTIFGDPSWLQSAQGLA